MIGILIFSIGVLAVIAMQASAISAQSDAQYRIEASNLVDRMMGEINLNVDRSNATNLQNSLAAFGHQPNGANCNFSGTASTNAQVTAWRDTAIARLPGSNTAMQRIVVDTGTFNQVAITLCWQGTNDLAPRQHTVVAYIN